MAIELDFGAVDIKLAESQQRADKVGNSLQSINDTFINSTVANTWNTKIGHDHFAVPTCNRLNNFVEQFNNLFPRIINDMVNQANDFLASEYEGQRPISTVNPHTKADLSVGWSAKGPKEAGLCVPDSGEMQGKVNSDLAPSINDIIDNLETYASEVKSTINSALQGRFLVSLSGDLNTLCNSAIEVVKIYNDKAIDEALQEEQRVQSQEG